MNVRKNIFVSSSVKVVCVKFSITIMINRKVMNKICDTPASVSPVPDFPYVVFVGAFPVCGFATYEVALDFFDFLRGYKLFSGVSLLCNTAYGDNKGTPDF